MGHITLVAEKDLDVRSAGEIVIYEGLLHEVSNVRIYQEKREESSYFVSTTIKYDLVEVTEEGEEVGNPMIVGVLHDKVQAI